MLSHRVTVAAGSSGVFPFPEKDASGKVVEPLRMDFAKLDRFLDFHNDFPQVSIFWPFNSHIDRPHFDWFGPVEWMSDDFKRIFREWVGRGIKHIKSRGRGYGGFCFQMFDETLDPKVGELCQLVHSVDPHVRMQATIPQAGEATAQALEEWGMNIANYHAPRIRYDNPQSGFAALASEGRELWFYGAADANHGSGKERDPLGFFRYLHWAAFHHGATGVHFWNMLSNRTSGWIDESIHETFYPMVYTITDRFPAPHDVSTAERVIPSRRWEHVRMGIEDYMLLKMANDRIKKLGARAVLYQKQLDSIVETVLRSRATDRSLFRNERRKLIELIEGNG